jgi:hypothetical protein
MVAFDPYTSFRPPAEALEKAPARKFTETVEVSVNLKDLDLSVQSVQQRAAELDTKAGRLTLDDGTILEYDDLLIATGSSAVKAPVAVIQQLAEKPPIPQQSLAMRANSVFRDELARYVQNYLALGDQELIQYRDKSKPVFLCEQFESLLDGWKELNALAPEMCGFISRGPEQTLPFLEEFLYWSKESFGLKPVVSVTDVTIYQLPDQAWIASKQIYASHYFDASLAITLAADDPMDSSGHTIYLAYINRSRIDLLGGTFAGLVRGVVRRRLEDGMRKNLQQTVEKLESTCALRVNASH